MFPSVRYTYIHIYHACPGRGRDGTVAQPRGEGGRGVQAGADGVVQGAEEGAGPVPIARGAHRKRTVQGTATAVAGTQEYRKFHSQNARSRESKHPTNAKLTAPIFVLLCVLTTP